MYSKGSDTKSSPKLRRAAFVVGGLTGLALMTSAGATAQTLVTSSSSNRLEIFNANRASGSYGDLLSSVGYAYDLGIALGDNGTIYYASGPTGLTNESIDSLSPTGQIKTLVNATVPFGGAQKLQYYDGTLYGMGYYHGIFSVDPTTGVLTNSSVFGSTFANNHNLTFSSV